MYPIEAPTSENQNELVALAIYNFAGSHLTSEAITDRIQGAHRHDMIKEFLPSDLDNYLDPLPDDQIQQFTQEQHLFGQNLFFDIFGINEEVKQNAISFGCIVSDDGVYQITDIARFRSRFKTLIHEKKLSFLSQYFVRHQEQLKGFQFPPQPYMLIQPDMNSLSGQISSQIELILTKMSPAGIGQVTEIWMRTFLYHTRHFGSLKVAEAYSSIIRIAHTGLLIENALKNAPHLSRKKIGVAMKKLKAEEREVLDQDEPE